jgi:hypothetical protein
MGLSFAIAAGPLTRGWVCRLQLLLDLASAVILGSEFRGAHNRILLSQIRDSTNLEGQAPVFISPRNRVAQLNPQALGSLSVASYHSQGYGGGIRPRLHTGFLEVKVRVKFMLLPTHNYRLTPYVPRPDGIEDTASNSLTIVTCVCSLAMALILLRVYTDVAYQWSFLWLPYTLHYIYIYIHKQSFVSVRFVIITQFRFNAVKFC